DDVVVGDVQRVAATGAASAGPVGHPALGAARGHPVGPAGTAAQVGPEAGAGRPTAVDPQDRVRQRGVALRGRGTQHLVVQPGLGHTTDAHGSSSFVASGGVDAPVDVDGLSGDVPGGV